MDSWRRFAVAVAEGVKNRIDTYKYTLNPRDEDRAESFLRVVQDESYDRILAGDLPAREYFRLESKNGNKTLKIDPENIPDSVLYAARSEFQTGFQETNGFAVDDRASIAEAIKTEGTGGTLDDIYGRYKTRIHPRLLPVLKEALVLKVAEQRQDLSRVKVYEWRGEIANNHSNRNHDPNAAHNLISL
ncbi:hypothetical protein ABSL23_01210 (plasmid) [Halobacterium sp. NMX12-1]|uniref:Uncharacterized protein n=1 Tax=Halobacterium sp. NMX12-1 TaxID=3166650 RepID=A0AAU8C8X0_9EURY